MIILPAKKKNLIEKLAYPYECFTSLEDSEDPAQLYIKRKKFSEIGQFLLKLKENPRGEETIKTFGLLKK